MSEKSRQIDLVADIGGTNARFGLASGGRLRHVVTLPCADHPSLDAAARTYLAEVNGARPRRAALAIAGPVRGDRFEMTNHVWEFSIASLRRDLGLDRLEVINDFAALALAVPALEDRDLSPIKPGDRQPRAPIALLGPGTGLGVAALVPGGDRWIPVTTEGGHRDLAATNEREWRIVQRLTERFGHASVERALSGPGLVNLYEAVQRLDGHEPRQLSPAAIVAGSAAGSDPACAEAVGLFCAWLGAVAGDLALIFGAHGGVFLGGGMIARMGPAFDAEGFRRRFVAKGRFQDYLQPIPVHAIVHPHAALLGAARALL